MGSNHVRVYSELKSCEVVGVVDSSEEALKKVKEKFGFETFRDMESLFKKHKVDAATVAVPTSMHFAVAKELIGRGINVLIEKPLADKVEDAEVLVKIAKEKNVKIAVGHIERFNPMVQRVKSILDTIPKKDIFYISTHRLNPEGRTKDSAITDLSTHDIDVMRYLIGEDVVKIEADAVIHDGIPKRVVATLDFGNGIKGMINSSLLHPLKKRELSIEGKDIVIEGNYQTQEINVYRKKNLSEKSNGLGSIEYEILRPTVIRAEPLKLELQDFLDAILKNREPLVNGEEGLKNLRVALEIERVAKKRNSV